MKNFLLLGTALTVLFVTSCKNETAETEPTTPEASEQAPATTITTTPAADAASTPAVAETGERPKLNPPHGEPFHRCEIAVGAPLDGSAPAPNTAAPSANKTEPRSFFKTVQSEQPATTSAQQPSMTQAAPQPTPTPTPTPSATSGQKPKLNPAHGQPFHRCDVAVGAPLPD